MPTSSAASTRQLINLEADDVTSALRPGSANPSPNSKTPSPDTGSPSINWKPKAAIEPPKAADVASLLEQLPIFAERLDDLPQPELRALLDALQFDIGYHPARVLLTSASPSRATVQPAPTDTR